MRQVHVEVTRIEGRIPTYSQSAYMSPRLDARFDIDGYPASVTGASQRPFDALATILDMTARDYAEIVVKIRDSWEHLRVLFTGYKAGWVDGQEEYEEASR